MSASLPQAYREGVTEKATPAQVARWELTAAIEHWVAAHHPEAITGRTGDLLPRTTYDDLALLGVLFEVTAVVRGQAREATKRARATGSTWAQVADALGVDDEDDAWSFAAGERPPDDQADGRTVHWRCSVCDGFVRDELPSAYSHPDDLENGHQGACPRRLALLDAWRAWRRRLDTEAGE